MSPPVVAILTSGVALGAHVPGTLLARRLEEHGVGVRLDVLEGLFRPPVLTRILANRQRFHRDFRLARAAHAMAREQSGLVDDGLAARLMAAWDDASVTVIVVFSGFWAPVVEAYCRTRPAVRVERCHVDAVLSPSFRAGGEITGSRDVWLMDADRGIVSATIPVTGEAAIPWPDRDRRMLVHGGGWGMGTYADAAAYLAGNGARLDVVVHESADIGSGDGTRYFMNDPDWLPWRDGGFPPFGEVGEDGTVSYRADRRCPGSFELLRRSVAVVSKPGGGTLLDSLHAATPMILLEPLGEWEARNGRLWVENGFGIPLAEWCAQGHPQSLLRDLHRNLLAARDAIPSYADQLRESVISVT